MKKKGFTYIEVMIAMLIVMIGTAATVTLFSTPFQTMEEAESDLREYQIAQQLARQRAEKIRTEYHNSQLVAPDLGFSLAPPPYHNSYVIETKENNMQSGAGGIGLQDLTVNVYRGGSPGTTGTYLAAPDENFGAPCIQFNDQDGNSKWYRSSTTRVTCDLANGLPPPSLKFTGGGGIKRLYNANTGTKTNYTIDVDFTVQASFDNNEYIAVVVRTQPNVLPPGSFLGGNFNGGYAFRLIKQPDIATETGTTQSLWLAAWFDQATGTQLTISRAVRIAEAWHKLHIEVNNATLTAQIDFCGIIQYNGAAVAPGYVGIETDHNLADELAWFDNFRMSWTVPDAPNIALTDNFEPPGYVIGNAPPAPWNPVTGLITVQAGGFLNKCVRFAGNAATPRKKLRQTAISDDDYIINVDFYLDTTVDDGEYLEILVRTDANINQGYAYRIAPNYRRWYRLDPVPPNTYNTFPGDTTELGVSKGTWHHIQIEVYTNPVSNQTTFSAILDGFDGFVHQVAEAPATYPNGFIGFITSNNANTGAEPIYIDNFQIQFLQV